MIFCILVAFPSSPRQAACRIFSLCFPSSPRDRPITRIMFSRMTLSDGRFKLAFEKFFSRSEEKREKNVSLSFRDPS